MRRIRECVHISLILFVLYALFVIVLLRFVAVIAVEKNDSQNSFLKFIARGMNQRAVVEVDTQYWIEKYPFKESSDEVANPIEDRNNRVKLYCSTGLYEAETVNNIATFIKRNLYKYNIEHDAMDYGGAAYVQGIVENVVGLNKFCEDRDIAFTYFAVPNKDSINFYIGNDEAVENRTVANRSKVFTHALEGKGVDTYVLAHDFINEGHEITYDMTNHWYSRDALFATRKIVEHLNTEFGIGLDESALDNDKFYDVFDFYIDQKTLIKQYTNADYEYLVPIESGNYQLICSEAWDYKGSLYDVFLYPYDMWILEGAVYHNMLTIANNQIFEAINYGNDVLDKKVVFVGDSFSWPMVMYLNQVFKHVVFIHNATFTGSLESYIEQNEPDVVLMLYMDTELDEFFTDEAFYLK